jgi:hypothetical protein
MPLRFLLALVAVLVLSMPLAAQTPVRAVGPGDEVRVRAPAAAPGVIQGEMLWYHGDTLAVREAGTGREIAIHVDSVRGLALNLGFDRRRSMRRGARLGAFLGAAVGFVAGPFAAMEGTDAEFGSNAALVFAGSTLAGTAMGAAGGALFARDHWQKYSMPIRPRPRVTLSVDGGARVGVSVPVR